MGEVKTNKIAKLGKLFGVLSSNLLKLHHHPQPDGKKITLDSLNAATSPKSAASTPKSPPQSPRRQDEMDVILSQQEDDVLYPLPNDRSRTALPNLAAHFSLSPQHLVLSFDNLVHPQPQSGISEFGTSIRSPPVSRSSSVNSHAVRKTVAAPAKPKSSPVSRALSVKKNGAVSASIASSSGSAALSPSASSTHLNKEPVAKLRFKMFEDGSHEHNLRAAKRQEKLSNMLKDLLGAKRLRDEAKSAVPNILLPALDKPPTLFAGLVSKVKNNTSPYHGSEGELLDPLNQDCRSFVEKYGRCQEVIGRGAFGVVRICLKKLDAPASEAVLYAVKEFRRKANESEKKYLRRLTSEFCILSSLKHTNIIDTLDLLKDAKGDYCEVMEFCPGGDLYTLIIAAGKLEYAEADCFFKQLIRGVNYMHNMGVAHRDLKPENVLLTQQGVLKITDFGNGECFKMAWETEIQLSEGVCGSSPYIAPEEFTKHEFDPRCVDLWACGVIYMAMRTGRQLWKLADPTKDEFFQEYLTKRKDATGYEPIELLKRARCRNVIYSILDPIPERRITGKQILNSEWGREIKVCAAADRDHVAVSSEKLAG